MKDEFELEMYGDISVLLGKTLVQAEINEEKDEILFKTSEGERYKMFHKQDCCEAVSVEEIVGDLGDILNEPLLEAEESSNEDNPPEGSESHTWTFYKLGTIKGHVNIRWLGRSNGYYSERVSLLREG